MDADRRGHGDVDASPTAIPHRSPLTGHERRRAVLVGLLPIPVAAVVLAPFAVWGGASVGEVLGAAVVYGGLLGLAAGFVYVDRVHARQCPRCGTRSHRGQATCAECGYDLERRPRYVCEERHGVALEPGLCGCGRRLHELPAVRGVGREIVVMLRIGGWLLAFLLGIGLLLQMVDRAG